MIGRETEEFLSKINPDVAFFSFLGISRDGRITDNNEAITSVRRSVIKNAAKVVCLLDSAKLNCLYTYTVCTTKDVDVIIT